LIPTRPAHTHTDAMKTILLRRSALESCWFHFCAHGSHRLGSSVVESTVDVDRLPCHVVAGRLRRAHWLQRLRSLGLLCPVHGSSLVSYPSILSNGSPNVRFTESAALTS
jgi:hypothetical protein